MINFTVMQLAIGLLLELTCFDTMLYLIIITGTLF